jgi:hypothetical protein
MFSMYEECSSRNFTAMLGATLQMDLTSVDIPIGDGIYSHLPNMTMVKNHVEEIEIDFEIEEPPKVVKESLTYFSQMTFPSQKRKILML